MIYGPEFTALTFDEFAESALPLVAAYKAKLGIVGASSATRSEMEDARQALIAHGHAWATVSSRTQTARRQALVDDFILRTCYE